MKLSVTRWQLSVNSFYKINAMSIEIPIEAHRIVWVEGDVCIMVVKHGMGFGVRGFGHSFGKNRKVFSEHTKAANLQATIQTAIDACRSHANKEAHRREEMRREVDATNVAWGTFNTSH